MLHPRQKPPPQGYRHQEVENSKDRAREGHLGKDEERRTKGMFIEMTETHHARGLVNYADDKLFRLSLLITNSTDNNLDKT